MAQTLSLMESSMSTAISSLLSSLRMLVPPDTLKTMDWETEAGTMLRKIPLVNIKVSA